MKINHRDIELRVEKVASSLLLSRDLVNNYKFEAIFEPEFDALLARLNRIVYCSDERPIGRFMFPASAWEHVKRSYAPKWFLNRWPVKLNTVEFSAKECFPDLAPIRGNPSKQYIRVIEKFTLADFD